MKLLSPSLLAAQQASSLVPCLELSAVNRRDGVTRLDFTRLYSGEEPEYFHAATMPADGSLLRVRITLPEDGRRLYYQRTASPSHDSDFSRWAYSGQYNAVVTAVAALGSEVSIFWIGSDRRIGRIVSQDHGVTWSAAELVDYTPTTAINGLAAVYKPGGELALFFADQQTLYVKKYSSGRWQARAAWDKTVSMLSGVAACYDGDWCLFITGRDGDSNYKLWSLVYGDGGSMPEGNWSGLVVIAAAPASGLYEYRQAFMGKPDVFRCLYVEKFNGQEGYSRPYALHTTAGTTFRDNLWCEGQPFNLASDYGLALAHHGSFCWLSSANGVWRAGLGERTWDLSSGILSLEQVVSPYGSSLEVELGLDGEALPLSLDAGCEIIFNPGYHTAQGQETSQGQSFRLQAYELRNGNSRVSLMLRADGGWERLHRWQAREQMRWNSDGAEKSVRDILAFILARAGLRLEVISASAAISAFYPDFALSPGDRGDAAVRHLLEMVPDLLFMEGNTACLLAPQPEDPAVYRYGGNHQVLASSAVCRDKPYNRVRVDSGESILVDRFDWADVEISGERLLRVEDSNIASRGQAAERGSAWLEKARRYAVAGFIVVNPNCGQQAYDVVDITGAGFPAGRMRVVGWKLSYRPDQGGYRQKLMLGGV